MQGRCEHWTRVPFRTFADKTPSIARIAVSLVLSGAIFLPGPLMQTVSQQHAAVAAQSRESHEAARKERRIAVSNALAAITQAKAVAVQAQAKVDVAPLSDDIEALSHHSQLEVDKVRDLTDQTQTATKAVSATVAAVDAAAAARAAAAAAQAAAQAAAVLAAANTPDGARAAARSIEAATYGWGDDQFQCLNSLWTKESGWSYTARNAGSGAGGIPQSLPASKMATAGADWATNAATQIKWGLGYIARSYGTPCSAWAHSQAMNWY